MRAVFAVVFATIPGLLANAAHAQSVSGGVLHIEILHPSTVMKQQAEAQRMQLDARLAYARGQLALKQERKAWKDQQRELRRAELKERMAIQVELYHELVERQTEERRKNLSSTLALFDDYNGAFRWPALLKDVGAGAADDDLLVRAAAGEDVGIAVRERCRELRSALRARVQKDKSLCSVRQHQAACRVLETLPHLVDLWFEADGMKLNLAKQ